MEKDSPATPSVAELAGRFKAHILPTPTSNNELPFRRRPPCSLKLKSQDDNEESDKANPFKIKMKNSAIIEKLQANLALSPTALLPSPKNPEVKLPPASLSPTTPCSPLSPTLRPSPLSSEEEDPIIFNNPPKGAPLPSINKTRARLSFKRRPPTRQHRRSAGEENCGVPLSPCELYGPEENGDKDQAFNSPTEERSLTEADEKDRDCDKTEEEVEKGEPGNRSGVEEQQEAEQGQRSETLEGQQQLSEPCPAVQKDGSEKGQEEMAEEKHEG